MGLNWRNRGRALLADGSESIVDTYEGEVLWDGQLCRVAIDEADTTCLIGMALLRGFELTVKVRPTGMVTIQALS